jgi:putative ABC transport system ATP-binding protein
MSIIRAKNLFKEYGGGENSVIALDNVSIDFNAGEFCAIIGASGSGKSTLLHILGGLDSPTVGDVFYSDKNIHEMNDSQLSEFRRKKIGFVFQSFNLIPELTAYENMIMPILLGNKKPNKEYMQNIANALGIANRLTHLPSQLSGGQQQRIAIARALVNSPDVLLCDEPTGNLDKKSGDEVIEILKFANRDFKKTVILITHDMSIAEQAERVVRLSDGKVVLNNF